MRWRNVDTLQDVYARIRAEHPTYRAKDAFAWARSLIKVRERGEYAPRWSDDVNVFEVKGVWVRVMIKHDYDAGPPWDEGEEGEVREVRRYEDPRIYRNSDERALDDHRGNQWRWTPPDDMRVMNHAYYLRDFYGYAMQPAIDEARRALEKRREWLEGWLRDSWCYVGLMVSIHETEDDARDDENEIASDSLWGIDYDTHEGYHHLNEEAQCMVDELVDEELERRAQAELQERIDNRFHDAMDNAL